MTSLPVDPARKQALTFVGTTLALLVPMLLLRQGSDLLAFLVTVGMLVAMGGVVAEVPVVFALGRVRKGLRWRRIEFLTVHGAADDGLEVRVDGHPWVLLEAARQWTAPELDAFLDALRHATGVPVHDERDRHTWDLALQGRAEQAVASRDRRQHVNVNQNHGLHRVAPAPVPETASLDRTRLDLDLRRLGRRDRIVLSRSELVVHGITLSRTAITEAWVSFDANREGRGHATLHVWDGREHVLGSIDTRDLTAVAGIRGVAERIGAWAAQAEGSTDDVPAALRGMRSERE